MGRPTTYPTGTTNYRPAECWNGYTLFQAAHQGAVLINMNGKIVHFWKNFRGFPNKMIKGGKIFGSLDMRDKEAAYQDYTDVTEVDWDGKVLWSFKSGEFVEDEGKEPRWVARQHHDYQLEGNPVGYYTPELSTDDSFGKALILCHNDVRKPKISSQLLLEDMLKEVDRDGNVLWKWNMLSHFNEFNLTEAQKNVIFRNPNTQKTEPEGEGDIFHVNCASYLGPNKWFEEGDRRFAPDNIILDSREANIMFIVSHETGKIVWQIGPDYTTSKELRMLGALIGMHHSHMIPKGLPGAGNILVFDNGGWAGYGLPTQISKIGLKAERRDSSRVIEFNPVTLEVVWEMTPAKLGFATPFAAHNFYSPLVSSAQRLPNGNTLVAEGTTGRFLEVTPDFKIVWEYIYPKVAKNLVYRAYRVPYDWIPQLGKQEEKEIIPPDNSEFCLPGAEHAEFESTAVEVEGAAPYGKSGAFCVDKL